MRRLLLGPRSEPDRRDPPPQQLPDRHDANGTVLRSPSSGNGTATVDNGTDRDAVVTLSQGGMAVASLYITRSSTAHMSNIPDGVYDVFFASAAQRLRSRLDKRRVRRRIYSVASGRPGGPRISMPCSGATAASRAGSGGGPPVRGRLSAVAGSDMSRMKSSNPVGWVSTRNRASSEPLPTR